MNNVQLTGFCTTLVLMLSCQPAEKPNVLESPTESAEADNTTLREYPRAMQDIFAAHGGMERWRALQSLTFEIEKEEGNEKHWVDLWDRRDRVEGADFIMGYDGKEVWMQADSSYQGDPTFYHNLMFYFFAMPFVLGDDGINYFDTDPLEFEGTSYPGVRIAYDQGVGASSKDEYYIHYHPQSKQMAWLGYTVTYFSQESSADVHWIRYDHWQEVEGVMLPNSISWYNYQDGKPLDFRNTVSFTGVSLSKEPLQETLFQKP